KARYEAFPPHNHTFLLATTRRSAAGFARDKRARGASHGATSCVVRAYRRSLLRTSFLPPPLCLFVPGRHSQVHTIPHIIITPPGITCTMRTTTPRAPMLLRRTGV